jgi:N utilization substance protein A
LVREEQIPNEKLRRGDYVKVYVVDVHKSTRGPVIKLSRTHRNLLRRLMEQEIPEVRDGTVEIKAIAREPGARSKAAVVATVPGVDPVGSCVGMRGLRIQNIVNELAGEKIDVVEWNTDLSTYIANSLSPAKVNSVLLDETGSIKTAIVVVPDRQLSLAIGKEGQNARLAAKLTGWRIDIKSESEAMKEGLDRLAAEQAQKTRSADLFSVVERFLQEDEQPPAVSMGEDLLSKAARALENMEPRTERSDKLELPSLEMPEMTNDRRDFTWPVEGFEIPKESFGELLNPEEDEAREPLVSREQVSRDVVSPDVVSSDAVDPDHEDDIKRVDTLPEVITADMLRARKNKGIDLSQDFVVPAELLVGLDEEELDEEWDAEEDDRNKGRGKGGKAPAKPAKGKAKKPAKPAAQAKGKKWRPQRDDDF